MEQQWQGHYCGDTCTSQSRECQSFLENMNGNTDTLTATMITFQANNITKRKKGERKKVQSLKLNREKQWEFQTYTKITEQNAKCYLMIHNLEVSVSDEHTMGIVSQQKIGGCLSPTSGDHL
jgi:hypothetical protein